MQDFGKQFAGKNVLITGGLGFIGSNLAIRLVGYGANVLIVDSLIPEYGGNLFNIDPVRKDVEVNISDVRDVHSMEKLIQKKDFLFNLAGQTSHMDSMKDPFTDLVINSRAQLSILETCKNYNPDVKIVFASTRQIYGKPDYLPVDEKHLLRPVDVNGVNKVAGEQYHILYNNVYGIRACALRLTNTYGPRMRIKDARQTFVGIWIKNVIEGNDFEVWGGEQLRDFTYVDDCVDAMLMTAFNPKANGKCYNLGGNETVSLIQLAEIVNKEGEGGYSVKQFPEDRKKIDIGDYYSDFSLIKNELAWSPKIKLNEGLSKTVKFYRKYINEYL